MLLGVEVQFRETALDHRHLVVTVVNHELRRNTDGLAVDSQNPGANGVERADGQLFDRAGHQFLKSFHHFFGGLVGKSHGQNPVRVDSHHFNQIGRPLGDDAGFAAAGAGQNEHGTFDGLNGFLLF